MGEWGKMKPIIGITTDVGNELRNELNYAYVDAIVRAGGVPVVIPIGTHQFADHYAQLIDGLLLTGGNDIDPLLFKEEPLEGLGEVNPLRDEVELALFQEVYGLSKPILGICRGLQIMNVALGGTIFQDIYRQSDGQLLQHRQKAPKSHRSHYVNISDGSLLSTIAQSNKIVVNSFHHQSIKEPGSSLTVVGVASDGIIESLEGKENSFLLGVQWHPEVLAAAGDETSLRMFEYFIQACNS